MSLKDQNKSYDHKRLIKHTGFYEIDAAFKKFWDKKVNLHLEDAQGNSKKVPVFLFTAERWFRAREDGIRDENGTLIVPLIAIGRLGMSDGTGEATGRHFADTQDVYTYAKKVAPKSSLVKNLIEDRPKTIDPALPIHEIYTAPVPDHYSITYAVSIWVPYVTDMNTVLEEIGDAFNFKSQKSFVFNTEDEYEYYAFKEDEIDDESNFEDFSNNERIIRKEYTFRVPGYILPKNKMKRSSFRRYLSQTKLVNKLETVGSVDELEDIVREIEGK